MTIKFITPNWPAPHNVKAFSTTRIGGFSNGPFASLNLGQHVGDDRETVIRNRQLLQTTLQLPAEPKWLNQVHGTEIIRADLSSCVLPEADASYTAQPGHVCVIGTADCLPILLCNRQGTEVAAIHAGWRGTLAGVIDRSIQTFSTPSSELMAWLGPAIGPQAFEVGEEVYEQFVLNNSSASAAFVSVSAGKWLANLYMLVSQRLADSGVTQIYGGEFCTFSDSKRFFSYRREKQTGRMATLIWFMLY